MMTDWSGHWHGFGPWVGTREEFSQEWRRVPGDKPDDERTLRFLSERIPPVVTGHALLRPNLVTGTWTDVEDAMAWWGKVLADYPPPGHHLTAENIIEYDRDFLTRGSDVAIGHYRGQSYASASIVCCPHRQFPDIPCPGMVNAA